jgi:hypothetical protein
MITPHKESFWKQWERENQGLRNKERYHSTLVLFSHWLTQLFPRRKLRGQCQCQLICGDSEECHVGPCRQGGRDGSTNGIESHIEAIQARQTTQLTGKRSNETVVI